MEDCPHFTLNHLQVFLPKGMEKEREREKERENKKTWFLILSLLACWLKDPSSLTKRKPANISYVYHRFFLFYFKAAKELTV
jgi:hypothetical protein